MDDLCDPDLDLRIEYVATGEPYPIPASAVVDLFGFEKVREIQEAAKRYALRMHLTGECWVTCSLPTEAPPPEPWELPINWCNETLPTLDELFASYDRSLVLWQAIADDLIFGGPNLRLVTDAEKALEAMA